MTKKGAAVVVGRFQVDQLHSGHIQLLRHAANSSDKLIVFVGNRPTPLNATNPLPFVTIEAMIRAEHPSATILPIGDEKSSVVWSKKLDGMIGMIAGPLPVTLYTGRDGFNSQYKGRYNVAAVDFTDASNATEIREEIGSVIETTRTWRRGVIWAMQNKQHHDYYAVDMACLRLTLDKRVEVLLARKPNEEAWRFPGGFVEPGETFREAAGREFHEETGLVTSGGFDIIQDFVIDDWRTQRQKGVGTKTVLTLGWYMSGTARAMDDIVEVKWFDILEIGGPRLVGIHQQFVPYILEYLNTNGIPTKISAEVAKVARAFENLDRALNS